VITVMRRNVWAYKRRLAGTGVAVFLGVAFLVGTLALGDTVRANFTRMFGDSVAGTSVVVRGRTTVTDDTGTPINVIDQSIATRVRAVEGVARAEPSIDGLAQLLGKDGKAVGGGGPPTVAGSWVDDSALNPFRLAEGRAPRADDEVVIDRASARKGKLTVGSTTIVRTPDPVTVHVVGIATFGSEDSIGGATYTAFTLHGAQRYVTKHTGQVTTVGVRGAPGVSQAALVARITPLLPPNVEAVTGAQLAKDLNDGINADFLDFFTGFLVVFAAIALLVATFSIHNTFTILAAQRTRESALLRALGATRRQVLGGLALEALAVGVVASLAGIGGGVAVATLLKGLFHSFGMPIPAGGLTVTTSTVITALVVGIGVTLFAGAMPAVRASRVAPLAALRDVAVDRSDVSRLRLVAGIVSVAAGLFVLLSAVFGGGSDVLAQAGLGSLLTLLGLVVSGPIVARRAAAVIGAPLPRFRGITGDLARQNAMRNPRRTAGTAAALLVGVGVVTLFTVFAASLKASVDNEVAGAFRGDLVIDSANFGGAGLSPQLASDIARLPAVQTSIGMGLGVAEVGGQHAYLTVTDVGRLTDVLDPDVRSGSIASAVGHRIAVSEKVAGENGWRMGQALPVRFNDGTSEQFTVAATYHESQLTGDYVMSRADWAPHAVQDMDQVVLIKHRPGVSSAAMRAAVEGAVAPYGSPKVQDRQQYVASVASQVNALLGLIYVMLFLAIAIALMGIANTLSLAVHERRRELGLLRAVGGTRSQVRSMVRWESVIVALFGTVGGLGFGVFLGWALVRAASSAMPTNSFAAPPGQLLAVLVLGALVGALAAVRPARRASRVDPLTAIVA
jgi:putative ABC transport system permease protein